MKKLTITISLIALLQLMCTDLNSQNYIKLDASFFSEVLDTVKNVDIYLPGDYYQHDSILYPVIYFLHGAGGNQNDYHDLALLLYIMINNEEINPFIIVKPDGSCEPYLGSAYVNSELYGNYEDFIAEDLIAFTENNFKVNTSKYARYIAGHSMGGGGALKLSIWHPELYRGVVCSSNNPVRDLTLDNTRSRLYVENDSSFHFNYNAGTYTALYITGCGAYSPNLELDPPFDHLIDTSGNFVENVLEKWRLFDPGYMIQNLTPDDSVAFFITCGTDDEYQIFPSNLAFIDTLELYDFDHIFRPYEGGHAHDIAAFMDAYRFIDSLYTQGLTLYIQEDRVMSDLLVWPNPFVDEISIDFSLKHATTVDIEVCKINGNKILTKREGILNGGQHAVKLNLSHFPPGVYILNLRMKQQEIIRKLIKMK